MPENIKLAKASMNFIGLDGTYNPWSPQDIDKMEVPKHDDYIKLINECRFYYRRDSIISTVINKLVEIGITELSLDKGKLSANEFRIFQGIKDKLQDFAEACSLEYLISGLVVPEVKYAPVSSNLVKKLGIKKYGTVTLPISMWLRDPSTIKINSTMVMNEPSYFVKVPEELVYFINSGGIYQDGTKDPQLYNDLLTYYPDFVLAVRNGVREILLENDLIIRRKPLTDSPYPTPYLYSALEALKHKRNLRKMDYSIAARVISAIQLIRLGNDDFPITADDEDAFEDIRNQMFWRNSQGRDVERIFQLFANHTLQIDWVMPDVSALLNESKYMEVNDDIFFALGFPRILTTGESLRSASSDPEFASLSPVKTMKNMQSKILTIIRDIVQNVSDKNNLPSAPEVRFSPIALHSFKNFVDGLRNLYDTGNLSRRSYDDAFGYNIDEELRQRADEQDTIKELKLEEFAPKPFSPQPNTPGGGNPQDKPQDKPKSKTETKPAKSSEEE